MERGDMLNGRNGHEDLLDWENVGTFTIYIYIYIYYIYNILSTCVHRYIALGIWISVHNIFIDVYMYV